MKGRWLLVTDGNSVHTRRLALTLNSLGLDVHLACFDGQELDGVTIHRLGGLRSRSRARYLLGLASLLQLRRRLRPDIVNAHYISSYGLMAALTGSRGLIQTAWGTDLLVSAARQPQGAIAAFTLRRAQFATGDSTELLQAARRLAPSIRVERFVFGPPIRLFDAPRDPHLMVLSPRAHEPNYQVGLILDAWRQAQSRMPGYRLVVPGGGSLTALLRDEAPPRTEFLGQLPHEELMDLMLQAAVVVSVPRSDASSAAVLEAIAAGSAVVASDLPANREWLPAESLIPWHASAAELADRIARPPRPGNRLGKEWSLEHQVTRLVELASGDAR